MRKQFSKFAQVAALGLALTFTLSCSTDGGGGNNGGSSSSVGVGGSSSGGGSIGDSCGNVESGTNTMTCGGKTYRTVKISGRVWMAENLNYAAGNSKCYDDSESKCDTYGRLYNWNTATKVCPDGWHLPTATSIEWYTLSQISSTKLKAKSGWNSGNGTDELEFSALPGGGFFNGSFRDIGESGYWWTARENNNRVDAYFANIYFGTDKVLLDNSRDKNTFFFSVRCVQDCTVCL